MESALGKACPTPIIPIIVGSADKAMQISAALWQRGLHVPAIRPPTVPAGTSRLRVSLSAGHSTNDVKALISALEDVLSSVGVSHVLGARTQVQAKL
jgi:8-amino-7-oxononanoate synthase